MRKMRTKRKTDIPPIRPQGKRRSGYSDEARRRIWIWLAAVLLTIIFLASECTNLLPLE
jgi:hypothetical protein